ncbi:MAG: nucleotidyltransferase family protein [Clostridia bacterium]|nr:nucleotidyltransferase family protein [Clostridia bacterium]
MKICACIVEYNPLHLGHVKHLNYIKTALGADKIIAVMSGNFTQRGEPAVLDKFTRARHAILAGADMVIELPTVFATSNAEVFAKGAVSIIDALNVCENLCFGVESGNVEDYLRLATALNDESKEFKKLLKENLEKGVSLAKAKFNAVQSLNGDFDENLVSSPNNILGLEYTKALLSINSPTQIVPMIRTGDHNDKTLKKGVTSATSIRKVIKTGAFKKLKKNMPNFVFADLKPYPFAYEKTAIASLITKPVEDIEKCPDCTEGLENRIKALTKDNKNLDALVEKITTKRYTETRVRRIINANLLGITKDLVSDCLKSPSYAKVLAINNDSTDLLSVITASSKIPLITRKSDTLSLKKTALTSYHLDELACDLYNLITDNNKNHNQMIII